VFLFWRVASYLVQWLRNFLLYVMEGEWRAGSRIVRGRERERKSYIFFLLPAVPYGAKCRSSTKRR
jgi:hypothetical protein